MGEKKEVVQEDHLEDLLILAGFIWEQIENMSGKGLQTECLVWHSCI